MFSYHPIQQSSFQFHKGTIRTQETTTIVIVNLVFQFHKGTIRTIVAGDVIGSYANFNSIKVRLERLIPCSDKQKVSISIP